MMRDRYQIAGDDSGHEYAIPVVRVLEWEEWINSEPAEDGEDPPSWAIRIDGGFNFADPRNT